MTVPLQSPSEEKFWFVAYVKYCHERKAASILESRGYEYYLPLQKVKKKWSDRTKIVDRLVLPRIIFIHATRVARIPLLESVPSILGYMTTHGTYTPVVVPQHQMDMFRLMVEKSDEDVLIQTGPLQKGDHVIIQHGPFAGLECDLVEVDNHRWMAVGVGPIGTALIKMPLEIVEKV